MTAGPDPTDRPLDGSAASVTLSTGRRVSLPLDCRAGVVGLTLTADWHRLSRAVPDALTPIRLGPRTGAVTLAGVGYREVAGFEPYDEFAAVVPATRRSVRGIPLPGRGFGGYVHALPVTTAASRTMGREIWGFPKHLAGIDVDVDPGRGRAVVEIESELAVELAVTTDWERSTDGNLDSYSVLDGRLCRTRFDLDAAVGVGIGGGGARFTTGPADTTPGLRELGLRSRVLGRFVAPDVRAAVHPPVEVTVPR